MKILLIPIFLILVSANPSVSGGSQAKRLLGSQHVKKLMKKTSIDLIKSVNLSVLPIISRSLALESAIQEVMTPITLDELRYDVEWRANPFIGSYALGVRVKARHYYLSQIDYDTNEMSPLEKEWLEIRDTELADYNSFMDFVNKEVNSIYMSRIEMGEVRGDMVIPPW